MKNQCNKNLNIKLQKNKKQSHLIMVLKKSYIKKCLIKVKNKIIKNINQLPES
jgi:hypothetical protein